MEMNRTPTRDNLNQIRRFMACRSDVGVKSAHRAYDANPFRDVDRISKVISAIKSRTIYSPFRDGAIS